MLLDSTIESTMKIFLERLKYKNVTAAEGGVASSLTGQCYHIIKVRSLRVINCGPQISYRKTKTVVLNLSAVEQLDVFLIQRNRTRLHIEVNKLIVF